MLTSCFKLIIDAIDLDTFSLSFFLHMIIRGTIVYFYGVTIGRFNKKLLGIRTPFNFILFVMLGSIFAQAIVDEKSFLPIMGMLSFLIALNGLMTALAFYIPVVEIFMKGKSVEIVRDGKILWPAMRKNFITQQELYNELGTQMHTHDLETIESAILDNNGSINFITKNN